MLWQLRLHLPALARLPKAWTLLYSLDQHGVLLNTLYTKCEAHRQLRVGASGIMVNPGKQASFANGQWPS